MHKKIRYNVWMHKKLMYVCLMYSNELIKGTLKTIVLSLLAKKGRMYGYEITQHVKEETDGKIQLTEGALYPLLHRLEAEGLLETEKENIGKRVRKYYRLTESGNNQATSLEAEFQEFSKTMNRLLNNFSLKPSYYV